MAVLSPFTDTGTGVINTARVVINADKGHYIRDQRAGESGFPTKIDHFDRIRITVLDGSGVPGQSYDKVFDVVRKIPIKSEGTGTQLQLELAGIERWLQKTNYVFPHYFTNPDEVFEDIGNSYNKQQENASNMPTLTGHLTTDSSNGLPSSEGQLQHFDFGSNEDNHYDRMVELSDGMASSGSNFGVLDFFDVKPTYSPSSVQTFGISVFSSGSPSVGSEVTIDTALDGDVNSGETDGGIDEPTGTLINAWGSNDAGSLPIEFSKFKSRQIMMPTNLGDDSLFPAFDATKSYKQGAIVTHNNLVYQADSDTSNTPPTDWTQLTTESYYGGTIQYSPWTDDKAALWKNSGTDPRDFYSNNFGPSMWDMNLIINDDTTFGTYADLRLTDPSLINTHWTYGGVSGGVYEGLRVLVDGTGTGDLSGMDNSIAEFRDGEWVVKYDPSDIGDTFTCGILEESRLYKWDNGAGSWTNITELDNGSHCFHPYESLENGESVFINAATGSEFIGSNASSSVKVTYEWSPLEAWLSDEFTGRTVSGYYKSGAWLNLRFPYPINTYNGIGEGVGDLYGGGTNPDNPKQPTFIDGQNMRFTHDGKRGFNQGDSSEDFGPLSSLDFWMKLNYSDAAVVPTIFEKANFKMRCVVMDRNDHVAYQDFILTHNDVWQSVSLPLGGFQIYRGRRPRWGPGFITDMLPPKGLDAVETIEWRHIKQICWQTMDSYDDFGRYHGGNGDFGLALNYLATNRRIELYLDALRFKKPLLVNSGQVSDLDIEPDFLQRPEIFLYDQLKSDALAELEKAQFKNTQYDITTTGRFDIEHGDFFFLKDEEIIDETDSGDNKVKLVAKHVEYSINESNNSQGGFTRRIIGARRFV